MTQRVPETPLPEVGENDEADHVQLSRRFLEHAEIEIAKGNRLQASEKIWGAVAHALKAVGEQRGWQHGRHIQLEAIALQLGNEEADATRQSVKNRERQGSTFAAPYEKASALHRNFYNNQRDWDVIRPALDEAREFIQTLNAIRDKSPGRFNPRNPADQRRLARLLGMEQGAQLDQLIPLRQASDVGFSPNFGYQIPRLDDGDNGSDDSGGDDRSGGGSSRPSGPPAGPAPSSTAANPPAAENTLTEPQGRRVVVRPRAAADTLEPQSRRVVQPRDSMLPAPRKRFPKPPVAPEPRLNRKTPSITIKGNASVGARK